MAAGAAANIWQILREINLRALKEEAERPFRLLVLGKHAERLADGLSVTPGREGTHPWVEVGALPLEDDAVVGFDAALVLLDTLEPGVEETAAHSKLDRAGVPRLTIVTDPAAASTVGAELIRPGEQQRLLLRGALDARAIAQQIIPALLPIVPPAKHLALARQLPVARDAVNLALIEETSRANALYALSTGLAEIVPVLTIPLAAADILVLTKNQLVMAYKIALASGREGSPRKLIAEILGVLGGGFLFRQVARELVGLIPVIGIVPKIAVAYAGTWVIGRSIRLWATEGERLDRDQLRQFYADALERGRAVAGQLVERARGDEPPLLTNGTGASREPEGWRERLGRLNPFRRGEGE